MAGRKLESLSKRILKLEAAHRKMHARYEGAYQVSKVMFAIISDDLTLKRKLMNAVFDATNDHMESRGIDEDFQRDVRASIDELGEVILAAGRVGNG